MKATLLTLALAGFTHTLLAQDQPPTGDLAHAYVTIPYSELRALWEAGLKKEPPRPAPDLPPVSSLVHRADYRLQLGENASTLEADYDVETLSDKWQTVPLLGGEARLDQASADDTSIVSQNGYALMTNTPGKKALKLHLSTPGTKVLAGGGAIRLNLASATVKRLTLAGIPAGTEARVSGQRPAETKDDTALFFLPAEAGEVTIELTLPRPEEKATPPQPSTWHAQSQVLTEYGEGKLHFTAHLMAHAEEGSGLEMLLALPAHAGAVAIEGDDVVEWQPVHGNEGQRMVRVRWQTRDVLDREVNVSYDLLQSPLAQEWTLSAPGVATDEETHTFFAVPLSNGLELKGTGVQSGIATERLPQWMRTGLGTSSFITAEGGHELTLATHWLPAVATAEAIVSESKNELRLVADGSMQATATYSIRHTAPMAWQVELPKEVELLTCTVNGADVRPVQRDNGTLELTLPASDFKKAATAVTFVYTAKAPALDAVSGQMALELPRTPLFIEHLEWQIAIPGNYEITAIDGNLTAAGDVGQSADHSQQTIALRKDFCRGERPAVALFYQRGGLDR